LLPPPPPPHVHIWYSLASAYLAAGQEDQAAEWFGRIIESSIERNMSPIKYVRSFYFLGKIHENRGEMEKAREYYRRFYEYWKDGDLDRDRVEEARRKL
jgi:tetratricopeptide (TPR) repeat protein